MLSDQANNGKPACGKHAVLSGVICFFVGFLAASLTEPRATSVGETNGLSVREFLSVKSQQVTTTPTRIVVGNVVYSCQKTTASLCSPCTSLTQPDGVVYVAGKVIGCSGPFTGGVTSAQAKDLCNVAAGWSVCASGAQAQGLGLTGALCTNNSPNTTFFATFQASSGNAKCTATGTNDVFGCGKGLSFLSTDLDTASCAPLTQFTTHGSNFAGTEWSCSSCTGTTELVKIQKTAGQGGVLCCKTG